MSLISVITTCKGRLEHLRITLPTFANLPGVEVVVVDFDCPQRTAGWVRAEFPTVKVAEVRERPRFNIAEARNIGARHAWAPWLLFLDADVFIRPEAFGDPSHWLRPNCFFQVEPRTGDLWGTVLASREAFDAIGGYDEAFEGWGSEDLDFTERLRLKNQQAKAFPQGAFGSIQHGDEARTQFHDIKDRDANHAINIFYRMVKVDLMRQGAEMDLATRKNVYSEVRSRLSMGIATTIQLPYKKVFIGGRLTTGTLRYDIDAPPR